MGASIPAKVHLFANSINVRRGAGIGEGGGRMEMKACWAYGIRRGRNDLCANAR